MLVCLQYTYDTNEKEKDVRIEVVWNQNFYLDDNEGTTGKNDIYCSPDISRNSFISLTKQNRHTNL